MIDLPKYDEKQLLLSVAHGDEASFSQLYAHYAPLLYPYVLKLVKMPALAEDVIQDIFLKLWEARAKLTEVKNFPGYLFTIARNHTLNILQNLTRSQKAMASLVGSFKEQRFDDEVLVNDYSQFVEKVLQSISPRSREIFRKCREQGLTYDEVAQEIGISKNAVKKHMVQVLRTFKVATGRDLGITMEVALILLMLHI